MRTISERPDRFGPNTVAIGQLLSTARHLSRLELGALDLVERKHAGVLLAAWDLLRDRLDTEPYLQWRFETRGEAWRAVQSAGLRADVRIPADTGYWRVDAAFGCGAARAARFAACALVAPDRLDEDYLEALLGPWRAVVGDPFDARRA
jgi:hypothetical protein